MKLIILCLTVIYSNLLYSQSLPLNIKTYLDKNFFNWNYSTKAMYCEQGGVGKSKSVITYDIDKNGEKDYMVKLFTKRSGYIVVFLNFNFDYKSFIVFTTSSEQIEDTRLSIKNEKIYINQCETAKFYLKYKNLRFTEQYISD